ncbi:hypothetical protein HHI36_001014 [Cryptolaemus montrouzieri]|uniref:Transposase n=1 Tax=Cryptolaemus montrouzieri TaxID=559131 RepID=A0ABD2P6R6_9CUCU
MKDYVNLFIFKEGTISRSCQDDNKKSVNETKVGGIRFIVLHAGNRHCFIPGAELVFSSKTLDSDYHGAMNQENIKHWNKSKPIYEIDNLAEEYGHEVLRLPPYHCIFNPIENIWGITKNYYRDHVGREGSSDELSLSVWKKAVQKMTPEVWSKTIEHTQKEIYANFIMILKMLPFDNKYGRE